ncbi:TPA: hypothetical protein JG871_003938 [Enterobacter hormaechei subsp. xiangfangensis]|nr:hypothetical protein [Enterobacter hormaechei subsp. xiangfangensis]
MKKLFWVVLAAIAVYHVMGNNTTTNGSSTASASTEQAAPVQQTISIDAAEFSKKMDDNEVAAMAEVEGRKVYVHGTIKRFNLDIADEPVVELSDGQRYSFKGVMVKMNDKAVVAKLHKGQRVTLSGNQPTEIMGSLYLHNGQVE